MFLSTETLSKLKKVKQGLHDQTILVDTMKPGLEQAIKTADDYIRLCILHNPHKKKSKFALAVGLFTSRGKIPTKYSPRQGCFHLLFRSTAVIISLRSSTDISCPACLIASPSSSTDICPSPFLSNSLKAAAISETKKPINKRETRTFYFHSWGMYLQGH